MLWAKNEKGTWIGLISIILTMLAIIIGTIYWINKSNTLRIDNYAIIAEVKIGAWLKYLT